MTESAIEMRPTMIGAPVQRKEDPRLLTGHGQYTADVQLPRMVHVAFVRSDRAHARILEIDTTEAAALRGVHGIYGAEDIASLVRPLCASSRTEGYHATLIPPLADSRVRYVGEPVVAVVAADRYVAEDARDMIHVDYEDLPILTDPAAALVETDTLIHDEAGTNLIVERGFGRGDTDAAFHTATHVVAGRYRMGRHAPMALETRACVGHWEHGKQSLTMWSATQAPGILRDALAELMDLPGKRIRCIAPDVGGGFGAKVSIYQEELAVAALARITGRPVKWVSDRLEDLTTTSQSFDDIVDLEMAMDANGVILGLRAQVLGDVGAYSIYPWTASLEPVQVISFMPGPYKVAAYQGRAQAVATNKPPMGPYRGVGRPVSTFAMERLMDKAAAVAGLAPEEIRRRNMVRADEFPYKTPVGIQWDRAGFIECLDNVVEAVDPDSFRRRQIEARAEGRYLGLGFASYSELTGLGSRIAAAPGMPINTGTETARLRIDSTGAVVAAMAFANHGQGLETSMAQVIADELGVAMEAVTIDSGDSDPLAHTTGTYASRSAVLSGGAATLAARGLREKILKVAAELMEASPTDLEIFNSTVRLAGTDKQLTFREIAHAFYTQMGRLHPKQRAAMDLEETRMFDPVFGTTSCATHAALVEVDPGTGMVEVKRYWVAEDCGRLINPMIVDGQVHGGVIQGIGVALHEELIYDADGQNLTASLADYLVPSAAEAPDVDVTHIETQLPDNLTGFRGMGEGGTIGAPGAIANAVANALQPFGADVDTLPMTPQRIHDLVQAGSTRTLRPGRNGSSDDTTS